MDSLVTVEYEKMYRWSVVEQILKKHPEYRLPNAGEATKINFKHQAIWISDTIGDTKCVMDMHWGVQCIVGDGKYGLTLVEDK